VGGKGDHRGAQSSTINLGGCATFPPQESKAPSAPSSKLGVTPTIDGKGKKKEGFEKLEGTQEGEGTKQRTTR